jgi:hypothetical protein
VIRLRLVVGLAVASAALVGVSWLSRVPMAGAQPDEAILRLSWRTLGFRIEQCRSRTDEELAALAPHMRTPEVCTGRGADYELRVTVDGAEMVRDTVIPAGARGDRPVYVFRDLLLGPGQYRVGIDFAALVPPTYESANEAVALAWEGDVQLSPREIGLITLDASGRNLVHRNP